MPGFPRTDLAVEAHRVRADAGRLDGVAVQEFDRDGFHIATVTVRSPAAAEELCKPAGVYHTVTMEPVLRREADAFSAAASLLADLIRPLLPEDPAASAMIVGLGNRAITPDAIGPKAMESIFVTRHLRDQMPDDFSDVRSVSAFSPGVLGSTGMEAAALVHAIAQALRPGCIIAVDALACSEPERLCRTIQISDTGITPGSGVGNHRQALDRDSLGVPVLAVGVPTVMDIRTVSDSAALDGMFVTPRDIDTVVSDFSKLIGYAINLSLQDELTIGDLDLLL